MHLSPLRFAPLLGALLALAGCQKQTPAAPKPAPTPPPQVHAAAPVTTDAGMPAARAASTDGGASASPGAPSRIEGKLQDFQGFSPEGHFAFATFSEGAGFHLLNVIAPPSKLLQRFQLSDDAHIAQARTWLEAHGFSAKAGAVPPGLSAKVEAGKVVVQRAQDGGAPTVLYRGNPFGAGGPAPQSAKVAAMSPDGRTAAVEVQQAPMTEFGGVTTFVLVGMPAQGGGR